jgi:uncharacterized membrane protein YfcA
VPVNLAVSLCTILAAAPARLVAMPDAPLAPFLGETAGLAVAAMLAAYLGAGWLRRLSAAALGRLIFLLLAALGVALLVEAGVALVSDGLLPGAAWARLGAALPLGFLIGAVSSVLGVAGGELVIPTFVFGYGAPIAAAGSLALAVSLPAVAVGVARHARAGAYAEQGLLAGLVVPMAFGSAAGALLGGFLAAFVPAGLVKAGLGVLLLWSARKVFGAEARGAAAHASG